MRFGPNGYTIERNTRYPDHVDGNEEMLENLLKKKRLHFLSLHLGNLLDLWDVLVVGFCLVHPPVFHRLPTQFFSLSASVVHSVLCVPQGL